MHQVGTDFYDTVIQQYKIRKEDDYYIVFFPEVGEYYAANEIGIDILEFFFQDEINDLFTFLTQIYGQLDIHQQCSVRDYVQKLCVMNIIAKGEHK